MPRPTTGARSKPRPESPEANHGLALASLTEGDWDTGFGLYEARERLKAPPYKPLPYPRWTDDAPVSERLVLLCEQGLGDMIQFCALCAAVRRARP